MYDLIDFENLDEWRKQNPDIKHVMVRHRGYGLVKYTFNYKNPEDITITDSLGMYDAWGNLHFVDSEGTRHICYKNKNYNLRTMTWNR